MFKSIRSQILLSFTVVMIISATSIFFIAKRDIDDAEKKKNEEKARAENEKKQSIKDALKVIDLVLIENFDYLLRSKNRLIEKQRKLLKNSINVINISGADGLVKVMEFLNANDEKILHNKKVNYNEYTNLMFVDRKGEILLSIDKKLRNKFICNIEKKVSNVSYFALFNIVDRYGEMCSGEKKNGYFYNISEDLILISFSDLSLIVKEEKEKREEIRKDLIKIFNNLKPYNGLGIPFIFNKEKDIIISPAPMAFSLPRSEKKINKKKLINQCIKKAIEEVGLVEAIEDDLRSREVDCFNNKYKIHSRFFKGFNWYYSIMIPILEEQHEEKNLHFSLVKAIGIISFFSIIFFVIIISRFLSPLSILSKKMRKAHKHDFTGDDHSELLDGLPLEAYNEAGRLAETFSFMIEKLSVNIKNLVETTAVKERMQSDLNVARTIQLGLLPIDFSKPKQKSADIHAYLKPAREVGGDLYDFFFIDEDHICFTVGDVADKGVPAALFMFCVKKVISSYAVTMGSLSPAKIMSVLNDVFCNDNPSSTFITLFIGILNIRTGELNYANGGHVPPIFVDCGSEPKYRKDKSGPAVGVIPGMQYKDITVMLQPGGAVFLCTDGVTEAMNENDSLFGDKRLLENFSCMKEKSCREVVEGILYEVKNHAGNAPQSDDIAMLMLRWNAKSKEDEFHV